MKPIYHTDGANACNGLAFYSLKNTHYGTMPSARANDIVFSDGSHPREHIEIVGIFPPSLGQMVSFICHGLPNSINLAY